MDTKRRSTTLENVRLPDSAQGDHYYEVPDISEFSELNSKGKAEQFLLIMQAIVEHYESPSQNFYDHLEEAISLLELCSTDQKLEIFGLDEPDEDILTEILLSIQSATQAEGQPDAPDNKLTQMAKTAYEEYHAVSQPEEEDSHDHKGEDTKTPVYFITQYVIVPPK